MSRLKDKKCTPCEKGGSPLKADEISPLKEQIDAGWNIHDNHHLERSFSFENFSEALEFTNRLGAVAEEEGHHPDIHLSWGKVIVELLTHEVGGLTENDFISAAKYDQVFRES